MNYHRSMKLNILQIAVIVTAVMDLIYAIFFLINPDALSRSFNLIINQPEDLLWRQLLGAFFLFSAINFIPQLFAPVLYRFSIWIWNVARPALVVLILLFSSVGESSGQYGSWVAQQDFFYYTFLIYLILALVHLAMLVLTRAEAREAKSLGWE